MTRPPKQREPHGERLEQEARSEGDGRCQEGAHIERMTLHRLVDEETGHPGYWWTKKPAPMRHHRIETATFYPAEVVTALRGEVREAREKAEAMEKQRDYDYARFKAAKEALIEADKGRVEAEEQLRIHKEGSQN